MISKSNHLLYALSFLVSHKMYKTPKHDTGIAVTVMTLHLIKFMDVYATEQFSLFCSLNL